MKIMIKGLCLLTAIALWIPSTMTASYLSDVALEAKVSAFLPTSHIVREICADAIPLYELEVSKSFCDWQVWLGAGYLNFKGHAIGCHHKTHLQFVPVTLGLKYFYPIFPCMDVYAGAGASWGFIHTKDKSPYVHQNISDNNIGGIAKLGMIYTIKECIFIDIFTEYLYQKFSFHHHYEEHYTERHDLDMSGFKIGGGLGFVF